MLLEVSGGVLGGFIGASRGCAVGGLDRGCSSMFFEKTHAPQINDATGLIV